MKILKVILSVLLIASIGVNIYQYNQLQNLQNHYNNQKTDILEMSEQIAEYESLLEDKENAVAELKSTISELKETQDMFILENQELEKQLEEIVQTKPNEEDASGAYLAEKMPEKPAETPAPTQPSQPSQPAPSQPSSGSSLSKDDIMSKLGGLGANGGMGGMTNGGQASADAGGAAAGVILQ